MQLLFLSEPVRPHRELAARPEGWTLTTSGKVLLIAGSRLTAHEYATPTHPKVCAATAVRGGDAEASGGDSMRSEFMVTTPRTPVVRMVPQEGFRGASWVRRRLAEA